MPSAETNDPPSFLEHARRPKSAYRDSTHKIRYGKMQLNSSNTIESNHPHVIDKVKVYGIEKPPMS